ncbi:MAG: hypothetical protein CBARDCOR_1238, partial [uncultured Caballeronia sp.]
MLKDDGTLVLTTPNVNRLENVARMIVGANIYDPYSDYGPYGRHNREYKHELYTMLTYLGFPVEEIFTADVNPNLSANYLDPKNSDLLLNIVSTTWCKRAVRERRQMAAPIGNAKRSCSAGRS